jgi:outer membrane immunogenic protein
MKRLLTLGAGLLSVITALPALATELPVRRAPARQTQAPPQQSAQPTQQSANWNGGQLGSSNGLSSVNNNFVEPGAYICGNGTTFGSDCFETPIVFSGSKATYTSGPFVGYRWQTGIYVAGVEADWSWKKASTSDAFYVASECYGSFGGAFCRTDNKSGTVTQKWDSSFRVRYGYLATPLTLIYATGGLAISEISGSFSFNSMILSGPSSGSYATSTTTWSDVRAGGTYGAGIETELWAGVKARFEYRFTDFGSYSKIVPVTTSCVGPGPCASPSSSARIDLRESFHTFRVGLGWDF